MRAGIRPAIIHDDRVPAERLHLLRNVTGVRQDFGFDDVVAESVVAVPAHRRRERESVAADDFDFCFGFAGGIFGGAVKVNSPAPASEPVMMPVFGIQRESGGKIFCGKSEAAVRR